MTIRNFLPGFGMRTVAALAVAAAVVVAALLSVGSPASAQSLIATEVYDATMTVGNFPIGKGYTPELGGIGSLSDDEFSSGQNNFTITLILDSSAHGGQLLLALDRKLDDNELESLQLILTRTRIFDLADAAYATDSTYGHVYTWTLSPRFGWSDNDRVSVKITAKPVVIIEAVTATVEYGGNNNAAESTAEFKFTRYGSTDEALSFRVTNGGVFDPDNETVTRTFKAGVSSFSNFHWAVDTDSSNDRICTIIWTVRSGSAYVVGTPQEATVDVEGPGTTCTGTM